MRVSGSNLYKPNFFQGAIHDIPLFTEKTPNSYQRLKSLVHRLTDTDLALSTDYGWTVAALLAHLPFGTSVCWSFSAAGRRVDLTIPIELDGSQRLAQSDLPRSRSLAELASCRSLQQNKSTQNLRRSLLTL